MNSPSHTKRNLRQAFQAEMTKYAAITAYLYVCFATLLLYKTALLGLEGTAFLPHGLALGKALIIGKFILVGEAAGIGTRVMAGSLLKRIAWKSIFFLVLLMFLTAVEEVIVGLFHSHGVVQTLAAFAARPKLELVSHTVIMLIVLLPLIITRELNQALGEGVLRRLLFEHRESGARPGS
jgi:hypothetical protein